MSFFVKGEQIILRKDGTWTADGVEISHDATRELFGRSIFYDALERRYFLKIGFEKMYIEVEDTPYFVISIERRRGSWFRRIHNYTAVLSDKRQIDVYPEALRYHRGALYLHLDDGMRAKFLSGAYYDFLNDLEEDDRSYYVMVGNHRVELSEKDDHHPGHAMEGPSA